MMFLTIIILGVVSLQTSNLAMLNGQKNQVQAHFLAVQGAQIVKGLGYSAIGACPESEGCFRGIVEGNPYTLSILSAGFNPPGITISVGTQDFQRKIKIENENASLSNAYKIRSIVEWEDSTGNHTLEENSHIETDLIVFN